MAQVLDAPRPSPAPSKLEAVLEEKLNQAVWQIRKQDLLQVGLTVLTGTLALAATLILLDRWTELPSSAFHSAWIAYLLLAGSYAYWTAFRPSRRAINLLYAAKQVEKTVPEAKNSIINWLELRQEELPASIRIAVSARAAKDIKRADPTQTTHFHALLTWVILSALFAILTVVAMLLPGKTKIRVLQPTDGHVQVVKGQSVTVVVRVDGRIPDNNDPNDALKIRWRHAEEESETFDRALEPGSDPREFKIVIPARQLREGLWYRIVGGGTQTPEYQVTVIDPPQFEGFEVTYHYPAYLRWEPETTKDPNLESYRGTQVTVTARTNRTLRDGTVELKTVVEAPNGQRSEKRKFVKGEVLDQAPDSVRFRFPIEGPGSYRIGFTSSKGETNSDAIFYSIKMLSDHEPKVRIDIPAEEEIALPANELLHIEGLATDDFGIDKMTLLLRLVPQAGVEPIALAAKPYRGGMSFRRESDQSYPRRLDYKDHLELAKLTTAAGKPVELQEGMILEYWLEAVDNCAVPPGPNVGKSKVQRVKILAAKAQDPAEVQEKREEAQRQQQLHEQKQDQRLRQEKRFPKQPDEPPPADQPNAAPQSQPKPNGNTGKQEPMPQGADQPANPQEAKKSDSPQPGGRPQQAAPKNSPSNELKSEPMNNPNGTGKQEPKANPGAKSDPQDAASQQPHASGTKDGKTEPKSQPSGAKDGKTEPKSQPSGAKNPADPADSTTNPANDPASEAARRDERMREQARQLEQALRELENEGKLPPEKPEAAPMPKAEGGQPEAKPPLDLQTRKKLDQIAKDLNSGDAAKRQQAQQQFEQMKQNAANDQAKQDLERGLEQAKRDPANAPPTSANSKPSSSAGEQLNRELDQIARDLDSPDPAKQKAAREKFEQMKQQAAEQAKQNLEQGVDQAKQNAPKLDPQTQQKLQDIAQKLQSNDPQQRESAQKEWDQLQQKAASEQARKDLNRGLEQARREQLRQKLDQIAKDLQSGDPAKQQSAQQQLDDLKRQAEQQAKHDLAQGLEQARQNYAAKDPSANAPKLDESTQQQLQQLAQDLQSGDPAKQQAAQKKFEQMKQNAANEQAKKDLERGLQQAKQQQQTSGPDPAKFDEQTRRELDQIAKDMQSGDPAKQQAAQKKWEQLQQQVAQREKEKLDRGIQQAQKQSPQEPAPRGEATPQSQQQAKEKLEQLAQDLNSPDPMKRQQAQQQLEQWKQAAQEQARKDLERKLDQAKQERQTQEKLEQLARDATSGDSAKQAEARQKFEEMKRNAPTEEAKKDLDQKFAQACEKCQNPTTGNAGKSKSDTPQAKANDSPQPPAQPQPQDAPGTGEHPDPQMQRKLDQLAQDLRSDDPAKRQAAQKAFDELKQKAANEQAKKDLDRGLAQAQRNAAQEKSSANAADESPAQKQAKEQLDRLAKALKSDDPQTREAAKKEAADLLQQAREQLQKAAQQKGKNGSEADPSSPRPAAKEPPLDEQTRKNLQDIAQELGQDPKVREQMQKDLEAMMQQLRQAQKGKSDDAAGASSSPPGVPKGERKGDGVASSQIDPPMPFKKRDESTDLQLIEKLEKNLDNEAIQRKMKMDREQLKEWLEGFKDLKRREAEVEKNAVENAKRSGPSFLNNRSAQQIQSNEAKENDVRGNKVVVPREYADPFRDFSEEAARLKSRKKESK